MASGPGQPAAGPPRLADSLARHRWITAAGMTATIAAVAGGGVALAFHDSSSPPKDCGLVPCAAALPAALRSGGTRPAGGAGSASAPATAVPTVIQRASAPPARPSARPVSATPASTAPDSPAAPDSAEPVSASAPFSSPAPVASTAGRAASANRAIGVGYDITENSQHGIHGQIVIVNNGSAPVRGWRVTVVLPGDTDYQVLDAGNRSAGGALVMAASQALAGGSTELIAFTARGTTSTPARFTFTDSARPRPSRRGGSGTAAGQDTSGATGVPAGSGDHGHGGWPGGRLGGWLRSGWPGGGWPGGGWPGQGWPGQGGPGDGRAGQHHGWPGGR